MENGASEALARPSLTDTTMFEYVPTCVVDGVPDRRPVRELNDAQAGRLLTLKVSASPFASDALGWKL